MDEVEDFYTAVATDEVLAVLQLTIEHASQSRCADDVVIRHMKLASTALEAGMVRRQAMIFQPSHGMLSSRQLARAETVLSENACEGNVSKLAADACSMSVGHFARSFKMSTGISPHRWAIELRMERSKKLLLNTSFSLEEISRICGYAEQCHFTRVFTRDVGMSPGAWRRAIQKLSVTPA